MKEDSIDTIIVPAHEKGFVDVFFGKKTWCIKRLADNKIKLIKYVAFYQPRPICAITYYGKIKKIILNRRQRYDIFFSGKPIKIRPIELDSDKRYLAPQGARYIKLSELLKARKISDIYGLDKTKPTDEQ